MEHSLHFDLTEPWRTRAIVAAAVALLELFVLLIVALALIGKPVAHRVTQAAEAKVLAPAKPKPEPREKPPVKTPPANLPELSRAQTSVTVLNANGVTGAAADQAARVRARGYTVGTVGNAPSGDYGQTLVMYRTGFRPEAERLARDLGIRIVSPLDGLTTGDLTGSHVAVILGD